VHGCMGLILFGGGGRHSIVCPNRQTEHYGTDKPNTFLQTYENFAGHIRKFPPPPAHTPMKLWLELDNLTLPDVDDKSQVGVPRRCRQKIVTFLIVDNKLRPVSYVALSSNLIQTNLIEVLNELNATVVHRMKRLKFVSWIKFIQDVLSVMVRRIQRL
jgi:hypothetical protein